MRYVVVNTDGEMILRFVFAKLVEYAFRIPSRLKIRLGVSKHIERCAFADVLPDEVLNRSKIGFTTPVAHWFRDDWLQPVSDLVNEAEARGRPYIDFKSVKNALHDHVTGRRDHANLLWSFVVFELWCRIHVENSL